MNVLFWYYHCLTPFTEFKIHMAKSYGKIMLRLIPSAAPDIHAPSVCKDQSKNNAQHRLNHKYHEPQ